MKENFPDMFDYLAWRGDIKFTQVEFCTIDALILAQLSYINFDGLLDESFHNSLTLTQLYQNFEKDVNYVQRCDMGAVINPKTPDLLRITAKSERFKDVKICGYKTILSEEKEEQFAAMTFLISDNLAVPTFRGTDDTLVGWKEDFKLLYSMEIPSAISGVEYLNEVSKNLDSKLVVVGHSKGAYVAVYSATNCDENTKNQIRDVYNFDGPGFPKAFFESQLFLGMKSKIHSYFPYFDLVGMLHSHSDEYKIVKSDGVAAFQHDPLSWGILGKDFEYEEKFADESNILQASIEDWLKGLSSEDIKKFVNLFFDVIYSSGAKTNSEIEKNKIQASTKMLSAFYELKSDDRKHIVNLIHHFVKSGRNNIPFFNAFNSLENFQNEVKNSPLVNKIEETIEKIKEKK